MGMPKSQLATAACTVFLYFTHFLVYVSAADSAPLWGSLKFTSSVTLRRPSVTELNATLYYNYEDQILQYAIDTNEGVETIELYDYRQVNPMGYKICPESCVEIITQDSQQMDLFFGDARSKKLARTCDPEFGSSTCSAWLTSYQNFTYTAQVIASMPVKVSVYTNGVWVRNVTFHSTEDIGPTITPESYSLCSVIPAQRYMFDICFLLDGSGSVSESDFKKMGYYIARWIRESCTLWQGRGQNHCVYSPNIIIRFDVVQTSNFATEINSFRDHLDDILYNLEHLERPGGLTDIGDGLAMCHRLFSEGTSSIPEHYELYHKVILISDGNYTIHRAFPLYPTRMIDDMRQENVEIFGISVYEDTSLMWNLVSDPKSGHLLDWNMYGLTQSVQLVSVESRICRYSNCEFKYCSCGGCVCPREDDICEDYEIAITDTGDTNLIGLGNTNTSKPAIHPNASEKANGGIIGIAVAVVCLVALIAGIALFVHFKPKRVNTVEMSAASGSFQDNPLYSETKQYKNPLYVPLDTD